MINKSVLNNNNHIILSKYTWIQNTATMLILELPCILGQMLSDLVKM